MALALWLSGAAVAAPLGKSDVADGYEIPEYGRDMSIVGVLAAPDGHLVLEFSFRRDGQLATDFYDTKVHERLSFEHELEIANDHNVEERLISLKQLTRLLPSEILHLSDGTMVRSIYVAGKSCNWPYNTFLQIKMPGYPPIEEGIFVPLETPQHQIYKRDCENSSGTQTLTTKYRNQGFSLFDDRAEGFYVLVENTPYLIHFDRKGESAFFRRRESPILVPARALVAIFDHASGSPLPQQKFVAKSDDIIDHAMNTQLEQPK